MPYLDHIQETNLVAIKLGKSVRYAAAAPEHLAGHRCPLSPKSRRRTIVWRRGCSIFAKKTPALPPTNPTPQRNNACVQAGTFEGTCESGPIEMGPMSYRHSRAPSMISETCGSFL
jgi:hypothetical protein